MALSMTGGGFLVGSTIMTVAGGLARRTHGILGLFLIGLLTAPLNAHWFSIVQQKVGLDLQGRGIALLALVAGAVTVLMGLAAFRYRPVRQLEADLPDAIPDAVVTAFRAPRVECSSPGHRSVTLPSTRSHEISSSSSRSPPTPRGDP